MYFGTVAEASEVQPQYIGGYSTHKPNVYPFTCAKQQKVIETENSNESETVGTQFISITQTVRNPNLMKYSTLLDEFVPVREHDHEIRQQKQSLQTQTQSQICWQTPLQLVPVIEGQHRQPVQQNHIDRTTNPKPKPHQEFMFQFSVHKTENSGFSCPILTCRHKYSRLSDLKSHFSMKHYENIPEHPTMRVCGLYPCKGCYHTFSRKKNLIIHLRMCSHKQDNNTLHNNHSGNRSNNTNDHKINNNAGNSSDKSNSVLPLKFSLDFILLQT